MGETTTGLRVIRPGLFSTVQDEGRSGLRSAGVPIGGAFDRAAHELANALAGNGPNCATAELTLDGGTFEANAPLALALAGAAMVAEVDGRRFEPPCAFGVKPGQILLVGRAIVGVRAYLAVRGGWASPAVLGSRSAEAPLRAGDVLPASPGWAPDRRIDPDLISEPEQGAFIRIIAGPDALPSWNWARSTFRVEARSDRMGLRLSGPPPEGFADVAAERDSAPVAPGAIQAAGDALIVLGVACGTMGGYPHVAHVISADLDRIAQARPGATLRFRVVEVDEARRLDRESRARREALVRRIRAAVGDGRGP